MNFPQSLYAFLVAGAFNASLHADSFRTDVAPLIESTCISCHDANTDTGLNFETLGHDLADADMARKWELIFDRSDAGEMPPESEVRPDVQQLQTALSSLRRALVSASLARQQQGRVPARRLTKLELGYTLQDLLLIDADVTSGVPDESESGSFDTIGAYQRISAVHMESYLRAGDEALGHAIRLDANPYRDFGDLADGNFAYLEDWHDKPINLGGSVTRKLPSANGVALFRDVDYLTAFTYKISATGIYRMSAKIAVYQSDKPITAKFIVKSQAGGVRLVKTLDLLPDKPVTAVVEAYMQPGDIAYLTYDDSASGPEIFFAGAKQYKGPGLAIFSQAIEGPLFESWPPPSTVSLLGDIADPDAQMTSVDALDAIRQVARRHAPRIFRRPVSDQQVEDFVQLAAPAIDEGRNTVDALKIVLRSMLSSPQFLLFAGEPSSLDDHALANRLSYFLWRSMPDAELQQLAKENKLHAPETLAVQVDRMLADEKAHRFVSDFVGQWLRLNKINATTPDDGLYPEFDELLGNALTQETELFLGSLIADNLSAVNLIDSDFTFVNRRLAEHYGFKGVQGQQFRRIGLPKNSPHGGVLTQAAVLKTTANGTTTSPVTRGHFVLTNFLGTPPLTPPPAVGSIEPDTRGQTTIREILAAHRDNESCNRCHRKIDPPGFALESFDPIGGFRKQYRASGGERTFGGFTQKLPPKQGPEVDPSGVTVDGKPFAGIEEFKQHLLADQETVVRNFVSQLIVFGTGGEIQFADREVIEEILNKTRNDHFPVRDIIHAIVQSRLFTEK